MSKGHEIDMFCIIKFGEHKHIKELYENGTVFMQRLSNYTKIEHDEIGDKNEGLTQLFQSRSTTVTVNGRTIQTAGGIKIKESGAQNPFIFSTYALTEKQFVNKVNTIDDRCLDFGDTALFIADFDKFFDLFQAALSENDNLYCDLVEYVDEEVYCGKMGIFKKLKQYQHQNEHRIVFETGSYNNQSSIMLSIGSLKDVAYMCSSEDLLNTLKIRT